MQQTEDIGCLTQRSQLDRLQELADGITRERVKSLQSSDLLATIVLVIGPSGKESTWDLDHLPMARSATETAVQLLLDPEAALGAANSGPLSVMSVVAVPARRALRMSIGNVPACKGPFVDVDAGALMAKDVR